MKDENVKKLPGYSWVDVDNKVHVFGVEDWCHPHKKEIDLKLDSLLGKIVEAGYVPDTESVPLDLEYDMKVKVLHRHSERIAIAYALIRLPIGKPIIVKKNIRVCVDCHSAIKLISKVEGERLYFEIIVGFIILRMDHVLARTSGKFQKEHTLYIFLKCSSRWAN